MRNFLSIADKHMRIAVQKTILEDNRLRPDALLQLNPACKPAAIV